MDVQVLSKTVFTGQYDTIPVIKKVAATAEVVKRTVTLSHFDCQGGSRAVSKMSPIEQDVHVVCDISGDLEVTVWLSGDIIRNIPLIIVLYGATVHKKYLNKSKNQESVRYWRFLR